MAGGFGGQLYHTVMHTALEHAIVVIERESPESLDADALQVVDRIWDDARTARPSLVDGSIFSVTRIDLPAIEGAFVPYRWFFAQHEMPDLHDRLHVAPLAVTARVMTADGYWVLGLRSRHTTQDRGLWEFVPAGGVDPTARGSTGAVDPEVAVRHELGEELAIGADAVIHLRGVGVVTDPTSHVVDVVFDVTVAHTALDLERRLSAEPGSEHDAFRCLRPADVRATLGPNSLAPVTREILDLPVGTGDAR